MTLSIALLHERPEFLKECCNLLNEEWKRSEAARMRSFENSSDALPVNLILLENNHLIGHLKLSVIPSITEACFIESVVIQKHLRGKGYGTTLMEMAEEYCKNSLKLKEVYLSTKGQEKFYEKLGYTECPPIPIFGFSTNVFRDLIPQPKNSLNTISCRNIKTSCKTYMTKIV